MCTCSLLQVPQVAVVEPCLNKQGFFQDNSMVGLVCAHVCASGLCELGERGGRVLLERPVVLSRRFCLT